MRALNRLNAAFAKMAALLGVTIVDPLWHGSLDSLAGRQLKWVYPATAGDDEFIKESDARLNSILGWPAIRVIAQVTQCRRQKTARELRQVTPTLGSRKLLQRATLIALSN